MTIRRHLPLALLLLASAVAAPAFAQRPPPPPSQQTPDTVRRDVRDDKRALVERNMDLSPQEAQRFWPIYDAYQRELDRIVQRQNRLVLDYVNQENSMTEGNARRMVKELLAIDSDELRLRERTANKMMAALPPRKAARFMQVENKIRTLNRYDLAEKIRLVR